MGTKLKQDSIPLSYTPRKFIPHPMNGLLYLIEGDHRVMSEEAAGKKLQEMVCALAFYIPFPLTAIFHSERTG